MYLLAMVRDLDIVLTPEEASDERLIALSCARRLRVNLRDITAVQWLRRSIDSRRAPVRIAARLRVYPCLFRSRRVSEMPTRRDPSS